LLKNFLHLPKCDLFGDLLWSFLKIPASVFVPVFSNKHVPNLLRKKILERINNSLIRRFHFLKISFLSLLIFYLNTNAYFCKKRLCQIILGKLMEVRKFLPT
jgi:hypothetical protein